MRNIFSELNIVSRHLQKLLHAHIAVSQLSSGKHLIKPIPRVGETSNPISNLRWPKSPKRVQTMIKTRVFKSRIIF